MRATYITATLIALAILTWLFSGQIGNEGTSTPAVWQTAIDRQRRSSRTKRRPGSAHESSTHTPDPVRRAAR